MVSDLDDGGLDRHRGIPGPKLRPVEPRSSRGDVQEGRHDDAGVGAAEDPLIVGKAADASRDEAIVGPSGKLDPGAGVGRRRDRVEQLDGREARWDQPIARRVDRRVGHVHLISTRSFPNGPEVAIDDVWSRSLAATHSAR